MRSTSGVASPADSKRLAVRRWVSRCLGSTRHEDQVAAIALDLIDATHRLHSLGIRDKRFLQLAAIVHDVGRSIDDDTHPQQGARLLLRTEQLPLDEDERRTLAFLTRYHRGDVPALGKDGILSRRDDHRRLRLLLAFLRAADSLDGRSVESPDVTIRLQGKTLQIRCELEEPCNKARKVYSKRKKFHLLEELLKCRVDVTVVHSGDLQLVA